MKTLFYRPNRSFHFNHSWSGTHPVELVNIAATHCVHVLCAISCEAETCRKTFLFDLWDH